MVKSAQEAAKKENVVISAGDCAITLLPEFGGKIASICVRHHELLQQPLAPIAPRTNTLLFDASDASGWDECLPSVAACAVPTVAGEAQVPDHGDLWRVAWDTVASDDSSATLRGSCFSLPLALERTLQLNETQSGCQLDLLYKVTNKGRHPEPWSWAAHALFAVAPGDTIELPETIHTLRLEGSGGGRLGTRDDKIAWPMATLADGSRVDLRVAQAAETGIGDKLFAEDLSGVENWCALRRPSAGVRIRVEFDPAATPNLGLWICYGGWPDRPGTKQMCVALEPSTAPVDSLAETGSWSRVLEPGQSDEWPMHVAIETL